MIYNWLKLVAVGSLVFFIRRRWKGMLSVVILLSATWLAHSEYLSYKMAVEETSNIGIAFVMKWLVSVSIVGAYAAHLYLTTTAESLENQPTISIQNQNDGFDGIRQKAVLRSKAQQIIDGKSHDNSA